MEPTDIYFLALPGTLMLDLAGVSEPFKLANRFGGKFSLHFVGPKSDLTTHSGLMIRGVEDLPNKVPDGSVVFVPGVVVNDRGVSRPIAPQVLKWLRANIRPQVTLCTVCSGAFLAAEAGLLDARQCTTHHTYLTLLARRYPKLRVVENRLLVRDGNVYSSAGVSAGVELALELVGQISGPLSSLEVAKFLAVYVRGSSSGSESSPWTAHRNHVQPKVHQVQDLVIQHPQENWSVSELAKRIHTSPRNLTRLFNQHAGIPPLTYLRKVRTAAAKALIMNSDLSIERVAESAGFASTEQMRRAWQKFERMSPSDARLAARCATAAEGET